MLEKSIGHWVEALGTTAKVIGDEAICPAKKACSYCGEEKLEAH